ncbi:conserved Plasmodium protein, unknown function [Plasmodium malariae]|uniref:Uncharacterized protein n=1 Tax=Plasmodium malariae TaxID=5858 RepID=A0A1D3SME7_PLAMA|nr:conserved Plasmodium protein, unknown function [Plasmodium malariae]SCO93014.1 conserved Plasmodium protein, unknown function [Plasmodium malariae]
MNLIKHYYSICVHVCTPEKYVIDQSEIEFSNTGKTNISFKVFDLYYTTEDSLNIQDKYINNFETSIRREVDLRWENRRRRKGRRKSYKNLENIKVLEHFFSNSKKDKTDGSYRRFHKENTTKECRDQWSQVDKGKHSYDKSSISVENLFDIVIPLAKEDTLNKTYIFEKKLNLTETSQEKKKKKKIFK